jgi:hypothetical protein
MPSIDEEEEEEEEGEEEERGGGVGGGRKETGAAPGRGAEKMAGNAEKMAGKRALRQDGALGTTGTKKGAQKRKVGRRIAEREASSPIHIIIYIYTTHGR